MPIQINQIPVTIRTPGRYSQFDNSRANGGLARESHRVLVMGQKLAAGTATADTPVRVVSAADAREKFGTGSQLANMFGKIFDVRRDVECWGLPVADAGAGVAAVEQATITGPATASGTIYLYVCGRRILVAVTSGDTASAIATAVAAAINAETTLPVTAAVNGVDNFKVDITARHKGLEPNYYDYRVNKETGEALPAGVGITFAQLTPGTTNPTLTTAFTNLGDLPFQTIAFPWTDATSLTAVEDKLEDWWGPLKQISSIAFCAARDSYANLLLLGDGRNSQFVSILGGNKWLEPVSEIAAVVAIVSAYEAIQDPALPIQYVELKGIQAPAESDRFIREERDLLLHDGISTFIVDSGGRVLIERLVTTWQEDALGNPDVSYLSVEALRTLARLRFTANVRFSQRYPRYKLANDDTPVSAGQLIVRPKDIRQEYIALFDDWLAEGLVEDKTQFIDDLVVERDYDPDTNPGGDVDRVNALVPPNLINGFRVLASLIQFRS